jgi:hypothetical protein
MQLQSDKTSLVIAGAWNPAILTPNWIAQNALGFAPNHEFTVGVKMLIGEVGAPQRLTFESLSLSVSPTAVTFFLEPGNAKQVEKSFGVALKIVKLLPHTPIFGVGINFVFATQTMSAQITKTFAAHDAVLSKLPAAEEEAQIVQQSWQATVSLTDHLANVNCARAGEQIEVALNHHFNVTSATGAAATIETAGLYDNLLALSKALIAGLNGEAAE